MIKKYTRFHIRIHVEGTGRGSGTPRVRERMVSSASFEQVFRLSSLHKSCAACLTVLLRQDTFWIVLFSKDVVTWRLAALLIIIYLSTFLDIFFHIIHTWFRSYFNQSHLVDIQRNNVVKTEDQKPKVKVDLRTTLR